MQETLDRVRAGEADPPCRTCGGILKSATISFGQSLVPEVIDRAMRVAQQAEVFLAVGTSLDVYPIAETVPLAHAAGARIVILNAEATPYDDIADAVFREPIARSCHGCCQCNVPVSWPPDCEFAFTNGKPDHTGLLFFHRVEVWPVIRGRVP